MNAQFHTPSFGDEIFDVCPVGESNSTSTPTTSMVTGNMVGNNNSYIYQQQSPQCVAQTKRMISMHNTSDEYHTANEESFTTANTNLMNTTNNGPQQQEPQGVTHPSTTMTTPTSTMAARKQMLPLGQNEPAKPLSAYALFFRDTVSAIKQQNPSCTFQELSKIVASMWDALDSVHKIVYNKKNELARNEYLNQMRIYRQQLEQHQQQTEAQEQINEQNSNSCMSNRNTNTPITSTSQQQLNAPQVTTNSNNPQQNPPSSINTNSDASSTNVTSSSAPPSDEQMRLLTEAGSVQKCTRESCTKRAIINPDWEDEYCSNECVVIHCRNVFNEWVQSNLKAKQQQPLQQQPLQQQPTTT